MKVYLIRKIYVLESETHEEALERVENTGDASLESIEVWGDVNQDVKNPSFASLITVVNKEEK